MRFHLFCKLIKKLILWDEKPRISEWQTLVKCKIRNESTNHIPLHEVIVT